MSLALTLDQTLAGDADRLSGEIYRRTLNVGLFNTMIQKETWQNGLSDRQRVLTTERNLPDDASIDSWQDVISNGNVDADASNCVPTAHQVPSGSTERSYGLQQNAFYSLPICVNDTRNKYNVSEQIGNMFKNLKDVMAYVWERRGMVEYVRVCAHKIVAAPGLPHSETHYPNTPAQWKLNNDILKDIYQDLDDDSAEQDGGSLGMADGRPQFILSCSAATSDYLFQESKVAYIMAHDPRRVPEQLRALGVDRTLFGFYHKIKKLPRRFVFTGGQYVEVYPYEKIAANKGTKLRIRQQWKSAPFEETIIFLPTVMKFSVPTPIHTAGGGTTFGTAQEYMGSFEWLNIQNLQTNPRKTWGLYYAEVQSGTKPINPDFGYSIIHLRCPNDLSGTACVGGQSMTPSELYDLADSSDVSFDV